MGYSLNSKVCFRSDRYWTHGITKQLLSAVTEKLQNRYFDFRHTLLFNDNRVIGRNKLETYPKIKTDFKREQYLYADIDKKSLSNLIKIRISKCNLNIAKGRYLKLPVEQRNCQLCHTDVEDEFSFPHEL